MITIYLIRHGETLWNKKGRYQGIADVELSEKGILQADKIEDYFRDIKLDAVISSPLKRAVRTGKGVAVSHDLPLIIEENLHELDFGEWEGKNFKEIEKCWPGSMQKMITQTETFKFPNGESFEECRKRAAACIKKLISSGGNKTYAVVCHGVVLRMIICSFIDIPIARAWNLSLDNASISVIKCFNNGLNVLDSLNGVSHLKE